MTDLSSIDPNGALGYLLPQKATPKGPDNGMGKDAFLKLLVAQMKYQDPMNPAQGADFVAQTAQFTVVESLQELQKQNTDMLASQRSLSAMGFIGRQITWQPPSTDGTKTLPPVQTGVVTGVKNTKDGPVLLTGKWQINPADVLQVVTPAVVPPTTPPAGTTGDDATPPTDGPAPDTAPAAPAA